MIQKKDSEKGVSEAEIVRYLDNSDNVKIKREAIHKRLYGTPKLLGLYDSEYVMIKNEDKHRGGHQEKTFHLTLKGLLGCLSTRVPLENIYLFKNYIRFISEIVNDKRVVSIVKQKITSDIYIFLLWHVINGIQLQKLSLRHAYFHEFFDKPFLKDFIDFSTGLADEQATKEVKKHFIEYFALEETLSVFRKEHLIPSYSDFLKFEGDDEIKIGRVENQDVFKANLNTFIDNWSFLIESLHKVGGRKTPEIFRDEYFEEQLPYSFDILGSEVRPRTTRLLKNEGIKVKWPSVDDFHLERIR